LIPTEAVVYIPEDVERDDGLMARRGVAHVERRGYRFVGVLRDWSHVIRLAREGVVVVFARRAHSASTHAAGMRREYVGEETCALIPFTANGETIGRSAGHDGPSSMVNEVAAYRSGYADGYVDSATLRSAQQHQGWRG
jgi:hypothetical protein